MLDLEQALNKLQSLEDRGISSDIVDLPSDEFVLYLVYKSLEQQCACDHKGFYFLMIDPLEEEPFDDVLFNVELNKTRLHANSKIKVSCLKNRIKKREKLFTVGLDSFDTADSIIKWICWETSPENLSLLENKNIRELKRSRKVNESFVNPSDDILDAWEMFCNYFKKDRDYVIVRDGKVQGDPIVIASLFGEFILTAVGNYDDITIHLATMDDYPSSYKISTKEEMKEWLRKVWLVNVHR